MISIDLKLDGDRAWPDLVDKQMIRATNLGVAGLAGGMQSGKPSVTLRLDLPDGEKVVIAETSLALFLQVADSLKIKYGDPRSTGVGLSVGLRPSVLMFAELMEDILKVNDHRGGWEDLPLLFLFTRLFQEVGDLSAVIHNIHYEPIKRPSWNELTKEAVDVANFCMMIAEYAAKMQEVEESRDE